MKKNLQKIVFSLRYRFFGQMATFIRKSTFSISGMKVGSGTFLNKVYVTWPHKVSIGKNCLIEHSVYFKHDGIWSPDYSILIGNNVFVGTSVEFNITKKISIGNDCLIASGCRFIDHDHGTDSATLMRLQPGVESEIKIGANVWIGCNVVVLKGVVVGDGAIIGAGAIVTKSIGENEIWAGVPAKKIGTRVTYV